MTYSGKAVYQNGVLRLKEPMPLTEGEEVRVTVHIGPGWADRTYGMMGWTGDPAILEYIAESPDLDLGEEP
jgi:predicted DNA-binding antitoxin AbrB/MazE fold protein